MRIALAQLNLKVGDFELNTNKIIEAIQYAKRKHTDLIVFPELAISAYPPRDF